MRQHIAVFAVALVLGSCAVRRSAGAFRVIPGSPDYLLRKPSAQETPFPKILTEYNGFLPGAGWVNLRPRMELRIENAYYREGAPKHGLDGFLGTEIARYRVGSSGKLKLLSVHSELKRRPTDQPPVQELARGAQKRYRYHRFFYAIVFRRRGNARGSVLLGASSAGELDRLAQRLPVDPEAVCRNSPHCSIFPEACSVALEMEIVVNGAPKSVLWGTLLGNIARKPVHLRLRRLDSGRLAAVKIDPSDRNALRLPLLPGDEIDWD